MARHTRLFVKDLEFYEDRARGLVEVHRSGLPGAIEQIREWHPRFAGATDESVCAAAFDVDDARLVYARQHGLESWTELAARVAALGREEAHEPFMAAFDALRAADRDRLEALLGRHPDLALARGTNGNSLLNLAVSLACGAAAKGLMDRGRGILELLLAAGADVNQANDRGWTPLHQAAYSNLIELAGWLIDAGAAVEREGHGSGGTPLAVALFWGHREAAAVLAAHAVVPRNLRIAAGLGRADLVEGFFDAGGALSGDAGAARGFYRPHSGFPVWRPTNEPQEILDEALVWACKTDQVPVLPLLVARGANVQADPYRGTPLVWAAALGRLEAARWLLDHGAEASRRSTWGGPTHGEGVTALHLASQNGHLAVAELLVSRGADLEAQDDLYHSTPHGWASHSGRANVRDYLGGLAANPPGEGTGS